MNRINLIGKKFGRLTVIEYAETRNNSAIWKCKCECGNIKNVSRGHLVTGDTKSCGCYNSEVAAARQQKHGHGKLKSVEYMTWSRMIGRCYNEKNLKYSRYGGRGIKVCKRWRHSFVNFLHDMGMRPSAKHSLDRFPNNDGNYKPSNCRWAIPKEQSGNRSTNTWISYGGKKMILQNWARELGIKREKIKYHLSRGKSIKWITDNIPKEIAL